MATTISTSQTYDSAARTAGDTYTIQSGAVFTIDSHTRDGKNSPASRAGSWSSFTMTSASGGKVVIDSSKVKYIKYDTLSGTPNVPTIGATLQGVTSGATGELMNISSAINAVPTAAGAAMPATGIIMFKSITGTWQDNEVIEVQSGGLDLCLANGTIRTGWLEIAMDDAATFTIGRAQEFVINNDNTTYWFESETTGSGSAHQQVQFPNYGGAGFFLPGCWVDEAADGNWEFWPATITGTGTFWSAANMLAETKNKFCECLAGGILRFGGNGTTAWGKIPTSGAKFRIPNVLLKSAATGSRASDSTPHATTTSRPDFALTNAGSLRINGAIGHWNIVSSQAYALTLKNLALFDVYNISETATALDFDNVHNGNHLIANDASAFILANNYAGGTIANCKFGRSGTIASGDYGTSVSYCNNITFSGCHFQGRTLRTNAAAYTSYFAYCDGLTFNDCVTAGSATYIFTCTNTTINDHQYADNYAGISSVTNAPLGALILTNSNGVLIDGFSWYTSTANQHPDTCIVYTSFTQNCKVRNIGTQGSPLTAGSSNAMLYFCNDAGNSYNLQFKRIYMNLIATTFFNCVNSTKKVEIANCEGNTTAYKALVAGALDMEVKNCGLLGTGFGIVPASLLSIYGSMFAHIFTSSTAGRLQLLFNEDSAANAAYVTKSFSTSSTGTSGFNSGGGVALINSGDYIICEFPWKIIGVDSFNNTAPTITTSTNMTVEYQINTGSGYGGTWKTFNASNLSGETVDEVAGFYFKIKCSANATSASNLLTIVSCITDSNSTAQGLQYPLDLATLSLTNLVTASDIVILSSGTTTIIDSTDQTAGTTYSKQIDSSTYPTIDVCVFNPGYIPYIVRNLSLTAAGLSLPCAQVVDPSYVS
jgi:hypothetical protein